MMSIAKNTMEVDSSTSDLDSDDKDDLLEQRSKELELQIADYVYSYDAYIELIDCYRKLLNLPQMRSTYECFSKHFPLTGSLWLAWIRDEIRIASTEKENEYVITLFNKAVEDYLSVDLWLEYVQFNIGQSNTDKARKTFERAISAVGLHVSKGSLIWDAYREFELAHLACLDDTSSEEWKEQVIKVSEVFRRQLSVPLLDMERTYVEWRVWLERLPNQDFLKKDQVEWGYKKATKDLDKYKEYENKLLAIETDEDRLKIYREYINEVTQPENARCLYERAIAEISLDPEVWIEYCNYFLKLENYPAMFDTCERALRNCPWSAELWILHMRSLEINGHPHEEVTESLEKALASGFQTGQQYQQIWLCYLDHYRRITDPKDEESVRKLRSAFQKSHQHIVENFGAEADEECAVLRLWANIEASFLQDMPAARKIWHENGIIQMHDSVASLWLELINMEKQYGDDKHVRRAYQRALSNVKDWPQSIIQSWNMYEREFGNINSVLICSNTCREYTKKQLLLNNTKGGNDNQTEVNSKFQGKKRKHQQQKCTKDNEQKLKQVKITDEPGKLNQKSLNENEKHINEEQSCKIEIDMEKEQRTVFLSNLDYGATEEQLKIFLAPVENVNIVNDGKGHSKGYAYCLFKNKEDADKALARDREFLNGRPVFISKCKLDRKHREAQFRYLTKRENHKLFVRGLPLTMTQEQVEDLFKPIGELKEVRLVTYRNGRSKGLAYIEFMDPNNAAKAILATDNRNINGHVISVAISDPPKRKTTLPEIVSQAKQPKSRLQIPFIPRPIATTSKQEQPSMTNEDFRKILNLK